MDIADHLRRRLGLAAPSGNTSLALLRERFRRAESELSAARAAMRSAAASAGIERAGLFAGSTFIKRTTGDAWHEAGISEGRNEVLDAQLRVAGLDPDQVRADIKARTKVDRAAADARHARWTALMRDAGWHAAVEAGDLQRAGRIMFEMHDTLTQLDAHAVPREVVERMERNHVAATGKVTAARVLAAGRRARMDGSNERPLPPKDSLAAQVLAAGRKARRPTGSDDE
jgi:hypothetical protein